jgi:hypothetical protein
MYYKASYFNKNTTRCEVDGKWVPARPIVYWTLFERLKGAWQVFTGKHDVLVWDESVDTLTDIPVAAKGGGE